MITVRRRYRIAGVAAGCLIAITTVTTAAASATTAGTGAAAPSPSSAASANAGSKPTIVLVHGAFADASGWNAEIGFLVRHGYPVIAPANPLRGLTADSDYIRSVLATIPGPVVLVGHSYGGMVITNAARGATNVKALVYISAFVPQAGESAASILPPNRFPGSLLGPDTLLARPVSNPYAPGGTDTDLYINPADFRAVFAADQTPTAAAELAATQRPITNFAFNEVSGAPAWSYLPSWDLVSLDDRAISPSGQQFMAARAGAHTVQIHSAHDSLITHADVVDRLILAAACSVH